MRPLSQPISAVVLAVLAIVAAAAAVGSASSESPDPEGLRVTGSFDVALPPQPAQIAAASNRAIYLVDLAASRVVAYSSVGKRLWDKDFLALGARRSLVAVAVDGLERVFVLDARQRVVHRLTQDGRVEGTLPLPDTELSYSFQPFRAMAADGAGGAYVLSGGRARGIYHVRADGTSALTLAPPVEMDQPGERLDFGGLVRSPDGMLLWRPAGRPHLERLDEAGRAMGTVALSVVPFDSTDPDPGMRDGIFATDAIAGGRFITQVVQRDRFSSPEGTPGVVYRRRLYVFDADGRLERAIIPGGLGLFIAAAPDGTLYFSTTTRGLHGITTPRVFTAVLD